MREHLGPIVTGVVSLMLTPIYTFRFHARRKGSIGAKNAPKSELQYNRDTYR
jgi:hypothetical protein